jgi:hypothetical protein
MPSVTLGGDMPFALAVVGAAGSGKTKCRAGAVRLPLALGERCRPYTFGWSGAAHGAEHSKPKHRPFRCRPTG